MQGQFITFVELQVLILLAWFAVWMHMRDPALYDCGLLLDPVFLYDFIARFFSTCPSSTPFPFPAITQHCMTLSLAVSVHAQVQLHLHFWLPPAGSWCWHCSGVGLHLGWWAGVCQDRYADILPKRVCTQSYQHKQFFDCLISTLALQSHHSFW